ncbi:MAG: N-acetylmuramoyl-L-alanine amidase [Myxococcales bacterium]|nr:N-acetylmuramoyl-L-alanine amidase [Myxococcales bacterium]
MRVLNLIVFSAVAVSMSAGRASAGPDPPTVVIDPGHGGSNTGAPGLDGATEKRITLAIARMVRRRLQERGLRVLLTRERDVYLTLGERVRRANGTGADLFVSLHANASREHTQKGVETYVGAREFSDVAAHRAAVAEQDPAQAMIARAGARQMAAESVRLARAVQTRLVEVRGGDRGMRQAPYDVLDGVAVPAVLVEVGFVDHAQEGAELLRPDVQARIAAAIADGIEAFVSHRATPGQSNGPRSAVALARR